MQFVIDTGVDVTILSYRVYNELNRLGEIERLTADGVLKGLDGGRIEVVGTATLDFFLGEICVRQQVWIAEIKEDCILGADFLMKQECVIDYPQNVLLIGSTEVPMHANTDELKCLGIVLDRTIKVAGNNNNNNNKFNTFIALFTIIDPKRFTELTIDTIFTLLISYIVMKLLNINIPKIQYPYLIKSQ